MPFNEMLPDTQLHRVKFLFIIFAFKSNFLFSNQSDAATGLILTEIYTFNFCFGNKKFF
jgi:hypothetical protein